MSLRNELSWKQALDIHFGFLNDPDHSDTDPDQSDSNPVDWAAVCIFPT